MEFKEPKYSKRANHWNATCLVEGCAWPGNNLWYRWKYLARIPYLTHFEENHAHT